MPTATGGFVYRFDIETNVARLAEHGKRADSIVRSVLDDSRGRRGERQPIDLKDLLEEYVNLTDRAH